MGSLTFESAESALETDQLAALKGLCRGGVRLNGPKVVAYVNHGRWVGDCVTPGCGGARELNPGVVYWCIVCGYSYAVEWPDKKVMREIDDVLGQRERANMNFHPDDYVKLHPAGQVTHEPCPDAVTWLAYENDVRGLPVGNDIIKRRYEKWLTADWKKRGLAKEMAGFNVGGDPH